MGYRRQGRTQYKSQRPKLKTFIAYNIYEEPYKRRIKASSLDEAIKKVPKRALRVEPLRKTKKR